ncbi:hypothetical protein DFQ05_1014 [Winogradskyella wandonensis]|uniref:Uncharacterized protein n=1 Tax=Winogradskyella wandonensis TaxID=1442586 RepID=A0A4V2PTN7_9FLAO|nr:hypothetical protein [Winogradskyella wandonensis]TCK67241.1 hypothetical protein DFQ05_1014 [Winogradskyella wandonensis]
MNVLVEKLYTDGHSIKFEYNRCHVEMYGQLTEISLRQKYFRIRIKDERGYSSDTYEKSDKLEFLVGSYARKSWIDRKTKCLEDYFPVIYDYIKKDSEKWADLRKLQDINERRRDYISKINERKKKLEAIEESKFQNLLSDADNYNKAEKIRNYLTALENNLKQKSELTLENRIYLEWARKRVDGLDPLNS